MEKYLDIEQFANDLMLSEQDDEDLTEVNLDDIEVEMLSELIYNDLDNEVEL